MNRSRRWCAGTALRHNDNTIALQEAETGVEQVRKQSYSIDDEEEEIESAGLGASEREQQFGGYQVSRRVDQIGFQRDALARRG